jgi:hypothetical protein
VLATYHFPHGQQQCIPPTHPRCEGRAYRRDKEFRGKKALRIFQRPGLALLSDREVTHATSRSPRDAFISFVGSPVAGSQEASFFLLHAGRPESSHLTISRCLGQRYVHTRAWGAGRCCWRPCRRSRRRQRGSVGLRRVLTRPESGERSCGYQGLASRGPSSLWHMRCESTTHGHRQGFAITFLQDLA